MMAIMFSASSAWFGLVVGVALLLEVAVLFVLGQRRDEAKRRPRNRQLPMLLCLGVMLATSGAARLRGWTGTGMTVAFGVGMVAAAATVVFAIRSLAARASAPSRATPPK
ncbi:MULTISPECIES: hypothetical protein [unclassified Streptomyces]|uniref:hypothetical protein n=1 Tax=unclassified Streptomyces TaxID=2593676 RepID=UPI00343B5FA5